MVKTREFDFIDEQVIAIYDQVFPLYIVKGERNFLIDSGVACKAEDFYSRINRVLATTSSSEEQGIHHLLLTHTHFDHVGAASYLQQKYGFDVTCSQRGIQLLQKDKVVRLIGQMNRDYQETAGRTSSVTVEKLVNLTAVSAGDKIRVDNHRYFEVIETPGHTQCSVAYLLHPGRILFPGDCVGLINPDGSIKPLFFSSYRAYCDSLARLIPLEAEVLAFSHNKFLKGKQAVKRHLERSLQRTRDFKDEILAHLQEKEDVPKIAAAIYEREFSGPSLLGSKESLLANLETMIGVVSKEWI